MAKIKLNAASGGGSVSLQAPSSTSSDRVYSLPDSADITTLAGILMCDQWYLTANKSDNGDITTNLNRNNQVAAAAQIGTGMTESSGIFTFGATGKYLVIGNPIFQLKDYDNANLTTQATTNNSSYSVHAYAMDGNNGTGSRAGSATSFSFIDVTDTSQVKVKFGVESLGTDSYLQGATGGIYTTFVFVRIGDT